MKVSYCSKTDLGTKYPTNSDAYGDKITKNGHVFVVADGNPIDENGSFSSKLAVQSVLDFFDKESFDNIYIGINHAFQFTNEQLYRTILSHENLHGSFVSMAVLVVREEGAYYGHIGNAKVAIQQDDQLTLLTKDHGYLEVQPYQADGVTQKIVKALGNTPSVYPSVGAKPILSSQGDVIILSTNGLFKVFDLNQLNDRLNYTSIKSDIINIIDSAKGKPTTDNLTFYLIGVTEGNEVRASISTTKENKVSPKIQHTPEEVKNQFFNLAEIDRKKMTLLGLGIVLFFVVIWIVFRKPKDDSDMVFEDDKELIKADTTNPNADLENMMEYDTPKEKEKIEEEIVDESTIDEELNDTEDATDEPSTSTENTSTETEIKKEDRSSDTKKEDKSSKSGSTHTVKSGDNLGRIAEKYHVKIDALRKANNLTNDQINIGQELKIPN